MAALFVILLIVATANANLSRHSAVITCPTHTQWARVHIYIDETGGSVKCGLLPFTAESRSVGVSRSFCTKDHEHMCVDSNGAIVPVTKIRPPKAYYVLLGVCLVSLLVILFLGLVYLCFRKRHLNTKYEQQTLPVNLTLKKEEHADLLTDSTVERDVPNRTASPWWTKAEKWLEWIARNLDRYTEPVL